VRTLLDRRVVLVLAVAVAAGQLVLVALELEGGPGLVLRVDEGGDAADELGGERGVGAAHGGRGCARWARGPRLAEEEAGWTMASGAALRVRWVTSDVCRAC